MEKNVRRSKTKYLIIEIFLLLLIGISLYVFFNYQSKLDNNKKEYSKLLDTYKEKEQNAISIDNELEKINENIKAYENIDKEIENTKKTYFETAKQLENDIINGKSNKKIAYLTFDDGPYFNTYKVLDILDKYNIKATFFTTSVNGKVFFEETNDYNYALYKEYLKRGHTIANHTYTHGIFKGLYNNVDSFMDAVIKQEEHIKEQTNGYITNIVRFPGGSGTAGSLKYPIIEALRQRGYGWVDWNAYDGDGWDLRTVDEAWGYLRKSINEDIEVFLFHDYCKITTDILPDIIKYLQDRNYIFLPLFYESTMINK